MIVFVVMIVALAMVVGMMVMVRGGDGGRDGDGVKVPLTRFTRRRSPSCRSKSCSSGRKQKQMEKNMVAWWTPDRWADSRHHKA